MIKRIFMLALALLGTLAVFGCGAGSTVEADRTQAPFLHVQHNAPLTIAEPGQLKQAAKVRPAVSAAVTAALSGLAAPALPAAPRGAKGTSVLLPYNFPADQPYAPGDAGYIASQNATLPGALGGADMLPLGVTYPDNFSYVVYRIDDITQNLGFLNISFGLVGPTAQLGVAVYNWQYGSNGFWEPLFYGDPASFTPIQLFGFPGEDFTNANDDLAFMVFCLNPSALNIQSFSVDEQPPTLYSEVESNDDYTTANALPAFNFNGWTGNVGEGGSYDGSQIDVYTFGTPAVGDSIHFDLNYDPGSDPQDQDNDPATYDSGMALILVDQLWWDTQGSGGIAFAWSGSGGVDALDYTLDGSETGQLYLLVANIYMTTPVPASDYTLSGTGPGGGGNYDEVEPNNDPTSPNMLATFPFSGFTGNVGDQPGGYDGSPFDLFTFDTQVGDGLSFTVTYDPAADFDPVSFNGVVIGIVDQEYFDTQGQGGFIITAEGSGGTATVSHIVDGSEVLPLYFAVQNLTTDIGLPNTDYVVAGSK